MAGPWRRFVVRPLVWFVAFVATTVLALFLFLGSDFARTRARALLEARVGDALGRPVAIERVDYSLLPLWIVLEGVTIASDRRDAPPFARLARVELDADWHGVRNRVFELARVSLDGLELDLEFRADGTDNLPRPPKGKGGGGLQLRLGGVYVREGRVRINEAEAPFALAAEGVDLRATGLGGGELDAAVAAERVELQLPDAQPIDTALAGRFRLKGERLEIVRARLSAPDLAVVARGEVGLGRPTTVALQATVDGSGALLDRLGWLHGELAGAFRFDGDFNWRPKSWSVRGDLTSPALDLLDFELVDLAGQVSGSNTGIELALEHAGYAGGALAGSFGVALKRPFRSVVDLRVSAVELQRVLDQFDLPLAKVRGVAMGPFRYEFDLLAAGKGDGAGTFELLPGAAELANGTRVEGQVALRLAAGELDLPAIAWQAGAQSVTGSGRLALAGGRGRFDLALESAELGGLVGMLPFLPQGELWVPTAGTARAVLALELAPGAFEAGVELEAAGVEAPGVRAERVAGRFTATDRSVAIESLELIRPGGKLTLAGTIPLDEPAGRGPLRGPGALDLRLTARDWPLDEVGPWLPFALPIEGRASGTIALGGSFEALHGSAEVAVAAARVAGVPSRRLAARFDWDPEELRLASAQLELDAGSATATGTVALDTERLALRLRADALELDRPPFDRLGNGLLSGRLALDAELGGTLALPELTLDGTFSELKIAGEPLDGAPTESDGSPGAPRVAAHWVNGALDAQLELPGLGRLAGGGELRSGSAARLEFRLNSDRLDRLVAIATGTPIEGLEGGVEAVVAVDLPIDAPPRLTVELPVAEFRWHGQQVRSLEPIRARLDGEALTIESVYLGVGGAGDELFVAGTVQLDDEPRLALHLQADFGAELVRPWLGDADLGGRLSLLADLEGTVAAPELRGQGEWSAGRYVPTALPHVFDHGQALVLLYPDAIVLDRLSGQFASGQVDASGRIDLAGGELASYRFELAARRLAVRWPPGWQTRGDADLTLTSTASGRQISGLARFDRLYYFQDIDLSPTQLIERLLSRSRVVLPETDELLATTSLNVALTARESVRVRNNVADFTASAELALKGSLARPVVFGELRSAPGGRVTYSGNRYEIERGILTFADSTRIDPQLDIVARTKVDEYDVAMVLSGALSRPFVSFTSDPPLADLEILGLLTTGSAPSGALFSDRGVGAGSAGDAAATGSVGAESLLYGQAASLVGARVGKLFGFDQVRVEPLTSGDAVSSARVTVGKRLSRRLFVTYSLDPTSTAQEILQAEWRVSDQLVLVLTQNGNESFSVDARWESRF